ncbi:hypothetical protein CV102_17920 [Natronococcus pandeyae]|uniref:Uncharacterized protein n=1 Tax=Natronococcus pandeyae TaxID=2055836 RepID=A0A8J8Q1E1_9EURY|nr:hypothetical protein CV102_17920 [Natronococcus pandeyae]
MAATAAADSSTASEGGRARDHHKIQNERQTGRSRVHSSKDNALIGAATKATAEQGAALIDSCVTYFGTEIEANRR